MSPIYGWTPGQDSSPITILTIAGVVLLLNFVCFTLGWALGRQSPESVSHEKIVLRSRLELLEVHNGCVGYSPGTIGQGKSKMTGGSEASTVVASRPMRATEKSDAIEIGTIEGSRTTETNYQTIGIEQVETHQAEERSTVSQSKNKKTPEERKARLKLRMLEIQRAMSIFDRRPAIVGEEPDIRLVFKGESQTKKCSTCRKWDVKLQRAMGEEFGKIGREMEVLGHQVGINDKGKLFLKAKRDEGEESKKQE
ncbi:unnamed protein product [Zymoseptoria tritici ST99CH_3D1]|nr:unnamed protein product [Zymoseptoria tritici ST99CH_3D1]